MYLWKNTVKLKKQQKKQRRLLRYTEQIIHDHITWIIHVYDPIGNGESYLICKTNLIVIFKFCSEIFISPFSHLWYWTQFNYL